MTHTECFVIRLLAIFDMHIVYTISGHESINLTK